MSRSRPELLSVGIAGAGYAVAWRDAPGAAPVLLAAAWDVRGSASPAPDWAEWRQGLAGVVPGRARVTIAADLVRWWTVEAPRGTRSLDELRQVAALRFEQLFDRPSSEWALVGNWSAGASSVCCAVPQGLAAGLRQAGDGWRLLDVAPTATRLRQRSGPAPEPRDAPWIWASLLLDRATLWWHRRGEVFKVGTLAVDSADPWRRIVEELHRVGSLWPDGALPQELHWASAAPVPAFAATTLRAVRRDTEAPSTAPPPDRSAATVAAEIGCA